MKTVNVILVLALTSVACGDMSDDFVQFPEPRTRAFGLEGVCDVTVAGFGAVDVETDYLPNVVACENPNAPEEALKAQAVQARAFMFYKLYIERKTVLQNSQGDQVYKCDHAPNGPTAAHIKAVADTKGQFLSWKDEIVATFFVAGAIPPNPDANDPWGSCMGNGGSDGTNTERLVTYNRGKSGCDIDMSTQGLVTADCNDNPQNRGTASQNGESCLASLGIEYQDMFSNYYGEDIVLDVATGACGGPPIDGGNNNNMNPEDEFDAYCAAQGDGVSCYNAITRIECADDAASLVEDCGNGCGNGECLEPTDTNFCTSAEDGAYCDGASLVECFANDIERTTPCPSGCASGACVGQGGTGEKDVDGGNPTGGAGGGSAPSVVSESTGVEGGCSSTQSTPGALNLAWLLLGFLVVRRRK